MATSPKTNDSSNSIKSKEVQRPDTSITCLARTRELQLVNDRPSIRVIGIDEAGRGPLAGPVVAAAIVAPLDVLGVMDSKQITNEAQREILFEQIIAMPNVQWAVAIMDASKIDQINILQATLEAMKLAATAIIHPPPMDHVHRYPKISAIHNKGCYVVCSDDSILNPINVPHVADAAIATATNAATTITATSSTDVTPNLHDTYYALIDGNRLPKQMPCPAETMVKGDSKEYCIAAASILAKVSRDRLMHEYHNLYPQYNFKQHKGYPTAAHIAAIHSFGVSPIHRRTFAPLKHMTFHPENGSIMDDKDKKSSEPK